jgi:hypothetical protein
MPSWILDTFETWQRGDDFDFAAVRPYPMAFLLPS